MKRPELLAPAGNMECLIAAINAGCDAVYIGGYTFGARSYASNFSDEEIIEAINYAHVYGVKVYITVNTIIYEDEVERFLSFIDFIHKNNVDAIIIQDLGMMDLVRKTYPNLEIHASTQMNVHNFEGAKLLSELGVKRVVMARETSIDIIKKIKEELDIEVEVFIHGALCLSYSGQCLMSSLIGSRSGNRGTCSQCCRMEYDLLDDDKSVNKDKYLLSTKDLNTLEYIGKLMDLGVESFKIEGRMKRREYVYLVTSVYRKAIDNILVNRKEDYKKEILDLKKIFNRDFTKGFMFNEENKKIIHQERPNHMGIEIGKVIEDHKKIKIKLTNDISQGDGIRIIGKKDIGFTLNKIYIDGKLVNKASKGQIIEIDHKEFVKKDSVVLKTTDKLQMEEIERNIENKKRINITGKVICKKNSELELTLSDGINVASYTYGNVLEAINSPTSKDRIKVQISKLNDTPFYLEKIDIIMDDDIFIKISDINELRRKCVENLKKLRQYEIPYKKCEYSIEVKDYPVTHSYSYFIKDESCLKDINKTNLDSIYVEKEINCDNLVLRLPRIVDEAKVYNKKVLISDLGSLNLNRNCITEFNFNVTNSYTVAFLHSLGVEKINLSYELDDRRIKEIIEAYKNRYKKHPNLELIISSTPEVMISKFDLLKQHNLKKGYLKDKFNNKFLIRTKDNYMTIYHYKKIERSGDYFKMGINSLRVNIDI